MSNNTTPSADAVATAHTRKIKSINRLSFFGLALATVACSMIAVPSNAIDTLFEQIFHDAGIGRYVVYGGLAVFGGLLTLVSWFQKDRAGRLG